MTTRKRVPMRRRASVRKQRKGASPNPARFLPTHERYTPALLAHVRQRFEETPEPIPAMAADLGVVPQSLHRIARRYGWVRRNGVPPPRDVTPALQILAEAGALDDGGHSPIDRPLPPHPDPLPAGGERERAGCAAPTRPELSTIDRLERAVVAELATVEAMRSALGRMPQRPADAARTVRTLGMLTQTLQHLQRLRASETLHSKPGGGDDWTDDDDMPHDLDEFRRELARRINAFVASRTGAAGDRRDGEAADVAEA